MLLDKTKEAYARIFSVTKWFQNCQKVCEEYNINSLMPQMSLDTVYKMEIRN